MSKLAAANSKTSSVLIQIGDRFGRLTVLGAADKTAQGRRQWSCVCDCGATKTVQTSALRSGGTRSCGCLSRELKANRNRRSATHGATRRGKANCTSEYRAWQAMLRRCYNPNSHIYYMYGGRGIRVCDRWRTSYEAFLADVGPKPSPQHSLDRYPDKNGDYEPGNVRWATAKEQTRNTRKNVLLTIGGETRCLAEWSEISGIHYQTLYGRLTKGCDMNDLLRPVSASGKRRLI